MLVSGRSLRRKAVETSGHLDRLAGLRDQRDINRGSAGMLRGLAERIRDKTIIMTGGIPENQLRRRGTVGIPHLDPITIKLHLLIGLAKSDGGLGAQQSRHVFRVKRLLRDRRSTGVSQINRDAAVDFCDPNQARLCERRIGGAGQG